MSTLLRHPATVPALFSRAVEGDRATGRPTGRWHRLMRDTPFLAAFGWTIVVLVEVPLVKAATLGLALPS